MANTVMSIRLPEELQIVLKAEARRLGVPRNALIAQILWRYVDEKQLKNKA